MSEVSAPGVHRADWTYMFHRALFPEAMGRHGFTCNDVTLYVPAPRSEGDDVHDVEGSGLVYEDTQTRSLAFPFTITINDGGDSPTRQFSLYYDPPRPDDGRLMVTLYPEVSDAPMGRFTSNSDFRAILDTLMFRAYQLARSVFDAMRPYSWIAVGLMDFGGDYALNGFKKVGRDGDLQYYGLDVKALIRGTDGVLSELLKVVAMMGDAGVGHVSSYRREDVEGGIADILQTKGKEDCMAVIEAYAASAKSTMRLADLIALVHERKRDEGWDFGDITKRAVCVSLDGMTERGIVSLREDLQNTFAGALEHFKERTAVDLAKILDDIAKASRRLYGTGDGEPGLMPSLVEAIETPPRAKRLDADVAERGGKRRREPAGPGDAEPRPRSSRRPLPTREQIDAAILDEVGSLADDAGENAADVVEEAYALTVESSTSDALFSNAEGNGRFVSKVREARARSGDFVLRHAFKDHLERLKYLNVDPILDVLHNFAEHFPTEPETTLGDLMDENYPSGWSGHVQRWSTAIRMEMHASSNRESIVAIRQSYKANVAFRMLFLGAMESFRTLVYNDNAGRDRGISAIRSALDGANERVLDLIVFNVAAGVVAIETSTMGRRSSLPNVKDANVSSVSPEAISTAWGMVQTSLGDNRDGRRAFDANDAPLSTRFAIMAGDHKALGTVIDVNDLVGSMQVEYDNRPQSYYNPLAIVKDGSWDVGTTAAYPTLLETLFSSIYMSLYRVFDDGIRPQDSTISKSKHSMENSFRALKSIFRLHGEISAKDPRQSSVYSENMPTDMSRFGRELYNVLTGNFVNKARSAIEDPFLEQYSIRDRFHHNVVNVFKQIVDDANFDDVRGDINEVLSTSPAQRNHGFVEDGVVAALTSPSDDRIGDTVPASVPPVYYMKVDKTRLKSEFRDFSSSIYRAFWRMSGDGSFGISNRESGDAAAAAAGHQLSAANGSALVSALFFYLSAENSAPSEEAIKWAPTNNYLVPSEEDPMYTKMHVMQDAYPGGVFEQAAPMSLLMDYVLNRWTLPLSRISGYNMFDAASRKRYVERGSVPDTGTLYERHIKTNAMKAQFESGRLEGPIIEVLGTGFNARLNEYVANGNNGKELREALVGAIQRFVAAGETTDSLVMSAASSPAGVNDYWRGSALLGGVHLSNYVLSRYYFGTDFDTKKSVEIQEDDYIATLGKEIMHKSAISDMAPNKLPLNKYKTYLEHLNSDEDGKTMGIAYLYLPTLSVAVEYAVSHLARKIVAENGLLREDRRTNKIDESTFNSIDSTMTDFYFGLEPPIGSRARGMLALDASVAQTVKSYKRIHTNLREGISEDGDGDTASYRRILRYVYRVGMNYRLSDYPDVDTKVDDAEESVATSIERIVLYFACQALKAHAIITGNRRGLHRPPHGVSEDTGFKESEGFDTFEYLGKLSDSMNQFLHKVQHPGDDATEDDDGGGDDDGDDDESDAPDEEDDKAKRGGKGGDDGGAEISKIRTYANQEHPQVDDLMLNAIYDWAHGMTHKMDITWNRHDDARFPNPKWLEDSLKGGMTDVAVATIHKAVTGRNNAVGPTLPHLCLSMMRHPLFMFDLNDVLGAMMASSGFYNTTFFKSEAIGRFLNYPQKSAPFKLLSATATRFTHDYMKYMWHSTQEAIKTRGDAHRVPRETVQTLFRARKLGSSLAPSEAYYLTNRTTDRPRLYEVVSVLASTMDHAWNDDRYAQSLEERFPYEHSIGNDDPAYQTDWFMVPPDHVPMHVSMLTIHVSDVEKSGTKYRPATMWREAYEEGLIRFVEDAPTIIEDGHLQKRYPVAAITKDGISPFYTVRMENVERDENMLAEDQETNAKRRRVAMQSIQADRGTPIIGLPTLLRQSKSGEERYLRKRTKEYRNEGDGREIATELTVSEFVWQHRRIYDMYTTRLSSVTAKKLMNLGRLYAFQAQVAGDRGYKHAPEKTTALNHLVDTVDAPLDHL